MTFNYGDGKPINFGGVILFDTLGNRHFRADHMSQSAPESEMIDSLNRMIGKKNGADDVCTSWDLEVFLDTNEFSDLINKLAPVYPTEVFPATMAR
jgi:hypothetical protein